MFKLKRINVVKMVESEKERDKLISQGFELVDMSEDEKSDDGKAKKGKDK